MLKRSVAAIRQWLSPEQIVQEPRSIQDDEACTARRGFFKKVAVGAVSITGTAGLAKVVVDSAPLPDLQDNYIKDSLAGEHELMEREYVLMSDQEKAEMIQILVDKHSDQT
jgi:hypothetical protein